MTRFCYDKILYDKILYGKILYDKILYDKILYDNKLYAKSKHTILIFGVSVESMNGSSTLCNQ